MPVPHAVVQPDRIPKERYYDPEFFALEAEQLWPRVWQMACRLEEIPAPGDYSQTEVGDETDTSPFKTNDPRIGISTGTYVANMATMIRFLNA